MPKNSLKNLLDMFPYFFTRHEDSNFVKSQTVTNNMFKDLYQSLRDTYDSFSLEKKCLIFKEQDVEFDYTMHFICTVPLIEHVEIFEEDLLIYEADFQLSSDETYSYMISESVYEIIIVETDEGTSKSNNLYTNEYTIDDDIREINYSYTSTSENIIPVEDYRISTITFDEYKYEKGFPENDTSQGDIFDHDISLDEIGALNNIPRKQYIPATNLARTEPPYNDRATEDDYHYMQRMLQYNLMLHTHPLPVAEIYKLYGLSAELLNRERLIIRMFDIFKHPHYYDADSDGDRLFVDDWIPEKWEHRDKICSGEIDLGEYFFVSVNTLKPLKKQKVNFTFEFVNCLAEQLKGDYLVDIYFNNELLEKNYNSVSYNVDISILSDSEPNLFTFVGHKEDHIIGTWEETITVVGCNDADFHIKSNGNDNNDGSFNHPFKTMEKAVSKVNGIYNLISVWASNNTVGDSKIVDNTRILGCNTGKLTNNNKPIFFKVKKGNELIICDLNLALNGDFTNPPWDETYIDFDTFFNENCNDTEMNVLMYNVDYGVLIKDLSNSTFVKNLQFNSETGILSWEEYTLSELLTLNDLTGITGNIEVVSDDDLYYTDYIPVTTDSKLLNRPFVYLDDRKELLRASETMNYDNNTGVLTIEESGDEIIWQPKSQQI